jgi:hypothetical protein
MKRIPHTFDDWDPDLELAAVRGVLTKGCLAPERAISYGTVRVRTKVKRVSATAAS